MKLGRILVAVFAITIAVAVIATGCSQPAPAPAPKPAPAPAPAPAPTPAPAPAPVPAFKWPATINVISATGVGQAQWVSFTALMGKDTGSTITVVPQGAPALRFKSVQTGENFATAGGASDWKNLIEADTQYAAKDGGPFKARIV